MRARNIKPVVIAGGGIGGLAAALALAIKGFRVIVLEQAHEFGEWGAGIQLAPNAWSALDALGVGELVKREAVFIERLLMMDGISGERVIDIPLDERFRKRYRNPYAVTHRADIHRALLDACIARSSLVELRTRSKVTRFELANDGVNVAVEAWGHMCYRAVLSVDDMPADLRWPAATLWAAPNTHIVHYPLRGWKLFNLVATVVREHAGPGHNEEALPEEVLPLFAKNCETPLNLLRVPTKFRRWMLRFREPVANWSEGPVTLLGDSAHLMLQYFAQGAAMAMEDAVCLASAADACDGQFAEAFQRYQAMRLVRASRVQISSRMLGLLYHAADVSRLVRNDIYRGRSAERYYDALDWIFTAPDYVRDFGSANSSQRRVDS